MAELHTPTSFNDLKSPILDATSSIEDGVAKTRELFGEVKQPLRKLNVRTLLFHSSDSKFKTVLIGRI